MSIELKITGNHATDIVAEVQALAQILGVSSTPSPVPQGDAVAKSEQKDEPTPAKTETPTGTASVDKKTLTRKEQDEAVSEMVAAGEKDDRYDMLTKGRQKEVDAELEKAEEPAQEDNVDDMFDDEPVEAELVVTREMVSKLMGETCKDAEGKTIQDKALKVRQILVDAIPEGQDVKVVFIPDDKLEAVYKAIQEVA